jgi:hypothetical protein
MIELKKHPFLKRVLKSFRVNLLDELTELNEFTSVELVTSVQHRLDAGFSDCYT